MTIHIGDIVEKRGSRAVLTLFSAEGGEHVLVAQLYLKSDKLRVQAIESTQAS